MALPGMDLQSQYNQTLQNTIGQSQAERLRQTRQQQSIANTDWQQRGVGEDAKRMAGFQEVNPSAMPHMSGDTRSFIQPLLGNYQEGGKQVEGYYGSDNPYTQGGLESLLGKQGYARAPSSLGEQFKSVGLKLPNAYGQDYYNASHEDVGNKISAYQNEQATKRAEYERQLSQYNQQQSDVQNQVNTFIGGLSNLANVQAGSDQGATKYKSIYLDPMVKWANAGFIPNINYVPQGWTRQQGNISKSDYHGGRDIPNGTLWRNGANTITYDPSYGYYIRNDNAYKDNSAAQFRDFLSAIAMNIGTAGLGSSLFNTASMGVPSAVAPFADATLSKALFGGASSALQGGDFLKSFGSGALSGISGTLGNAIGGGIASALSPTFGKTVGDIFGGGVGGFSGNALKNILQGKSLDIGTALSTLQGATGGLGRLFSNTNEDKQTVNGPTKLADTLQGVRNGPAATFRRT